MSSSYIVEPQEGSSKKDDTLILMVNDHGVISVDQDTLQNMILNQSNANVSVVRLGQVGNDAAEGNITLTVDPPPFIASETNVANNVSDSAALVDPFMEMDPEQLERLETALQSEEAKKILGENVTAMLDMLTIEEQQNSIRYSIELDHCYTKLSQPKLIDPLPDINSTELNESICIEVNKSTAPLLSVSSSSVISNASITPMKQKVASMTPKIIKQPVSVGGRPRRASAAMQPITTTPKISTNTNARIPPNSLPLENKADSKNEVEQEDDGLFSSSESSESNESDSDSDFGPRSSRKGVKSRGGRRGLTTRGGSMSASRRRGINKQMDSEQVRRLDIEMAAAVSAMKSPEKEDKSDKHNTSKIKKQIKTISGKKIDDIPAAHTSVTELPPVETNVLQTTNQVKASLINANMFKGDMILTKPGQDRNNQKVIFVQKQVSMNPSDLKTFGIKKQVIIPKNKLITTTLQTSKAMNKDLKVSSSPSAIIVKGVTPNVQQTAPSHQIISHMEVQTEAPQNQIQLQNQLKVSPAVIKIKSIETKKERKKSDLVSETPIKATVDTLKSSETKNQHGLKKVMKKEHRKSDTFVEQALGPALFSTPDIIRRVGSTGESKGPECLLTTVSTLPLSTASTTCTTESISPVVSTISMISTPATNTAVSNKVHLSIDANTSINNSIHETLNVKLDTDSSMLSETLNVDKMDDKTSIAELLQPSLESVSNQTLPTEIHSPMEQITSSKHIVSESGIESDDHLLATLGMEAAKQLPNDEELLAEALLLQETLGVDLENSGLVDPTPEISESILSSSVMESTPPTLPPNIISSVLKAEPTITISSSILPLSSTLLTSVAKNEMINKRDEKGPIQIIRGGRVITLPPIEAPATRSKKLQTKSDHQPKADKKQIVQQQLQVQPKVEPLVIKTERVARTSSHVSFKKQDMIYDMEDDDAEEANSDSEDDPNRLWCICKQPHNNRFMICCDMCQDWFHGKCVHVTKAMGEQMEHQGVEWVCPNCSKKKSEENKTKLNQKRQRNSTDSKVVDQNQSALMSKSSTLNEVKANTNSTKNPGTSGVTFCVVCKKEARKSSIFCSDACILAHAEVTSTKDKPSPMPQAKTPKLDTTKLKSEARIIVYDKQTGKLLTGTNAPTALNLKTWLKEHPNFEVAKPNNLNTLQIGGRTVATIQTQGIKTNKVQQGKTMMQPKMSFSKVAGSKQTVLAPSTKKAVLVNSSPSGHAAASPQQRLKQVVSATPTKNPTPQLKQTTIKIVSQQEQQQTPQKPSATSTPKAPLSKKLPESKPSTSQQKQQLQTTIKTPPSKKPETEPIRLNVRKTLAELLIARIKEAKDLVITDEEITEIALQIELELFKYFKDTGAKYKSKYRSLVFNIKDSKNLTLFRKIANRSLTPDAVVRLSPEEMASHELAEWREKENKHQLEMIKKNELDLMAQAKSIVVKTHKGEQIIENDGGIDHDLKTPVQDIVTALNSGDDISSTVEEDSKQKEDRLIEEFLKSRDLEEDKKKKKKEKDRDREKRNARSHDRSNKESIDKRDRSSSKSKHRHRERSRDRKSKKDGKHKDKDRNRDKKKDKKDKRKRSRSSSRGRSKSSHKEQKDKHKKEEDKKKDVSKSESLALTSDKPIEDRLWRHIEDETTTNTLDGNDSDISDREPSSTVTIKTPDINEEIEKELTEVKTVEEAKGTVTVWRGFVHMPDVAKFFVTAQNVSGNSKELMEDLPDTFDVVGRINPATVWDYINKMKKNATKEILIIKLAATNDEEKIPYITLYSYLDSRNRLGVVGNISPNIKDFYIMPFSVNSKLPSVLLPIDGPGFEDNRQHMLLGIIVVNSRKRSANAPPPLTPIPTKIVKKDQVISNDRSYTPPPTLHLLPSSGKGSSESMSPTDSPRHTAQIKISSQEIKQSYSVISKIVPELSSKITLESSSSSDKMQLNDDDDEPYSPGEPVDIALDDDEDALSSSSSLKLPQQLTDTTTVVGVSSLTCSSELQRKMEELSRQIEEEKMQIQNISSSFRSDTSTTLPGLGLDPPDSGDGIEAYSPSDARSFTPPPQGISKLAQPILEKVSNIMIPPNLQEILANVKRQENSKVDSYLPSKPGASFLTTVTSGIQQNPEKYSPTYGKVSNVNKLSLEVQSTPSKETKSTLSSLSDYDLVKKAEEELAALEAASNASPLPEITPPPLILPPTSEPPPRTLFDTPHR